MADINDLQMQKNKQLMDAFQEINQNEMRNAYSLKEQTFEDQRQAEYYSVASAQQESVKIHELLNNAEDLNLSPEDTEALLIRENRNQNFLLINNEKFGGDSPLMEEVKKRIRIYESSIRTDKQFEGTLREDNATMAANMSSQIQGIIDACDDYLKRGPSFFFWRRGRYRAVLEAKERFLKEKEIIENLGKQQDEMREEINREDTLLSAMTNVTKLKKVADKRTEERVRKTNQELKQQSDQFNKDFSAAYDTEKENLKEKAKLVHISRPSQCAAVILKHFRNGSDDDMISNYNDLAINLSTCTAEEKSKKLRAVESVFKEMLNYDMKNFDISNLSDLYGQKGLKNKLMCYLGMETEYFVEEYQKLIKANDPDIALNEAQLNEVIARRRSLESIASWTDSITKIFATGEGMSVDIAKQLTRSVDDLEAELDSFKGVVTPKSVIIQSLYITKQLNVGPDGAELYGIGISADVMLKKERKELGLDPEKDGAADAVSTIEKKVIDEKAEKKKREEKEKERKEQEHKERERKAASSGGARVGEAMNDRVQGKAPTDDIDAQMSKRKARIEEEEEDRKHEELLKSLDKTIMERDGITQDELNKKYEEMDKEEKEEEEEEKSPMTIQEKWADLVETAKEMGMTGKEILNWRHDFFADYVEEMKTEQGPQTLEERWKELEKNAKEMGMTGKEILNWKNDFFAEAEKQEHIEKERKAAASGGARVGDAMNDKVKGKTPTDDIDAKMSKRKARIEKEEKEKAEKERLEKEKAEKERLEKERIEKERKAAASGGARVGEAMNDKVKGKAPTDEIDKKMSKRKERIEKEEKEKAEKERLEKERLEKERIEKERKAAAGGGARVGDALKDKVHGKAPTDEIDKKMSKRKERIEKAEKEKAEKERLEKEKAEKERLEKEKAEKERLEKEKAEKERQEKAKKEKIEKKPVNAKAEKERLEKEKAEKKRLEKERIEKEKAEKKRLEKERAEKAKAEKAKKAQEAAEKKERELRAKKAKQEAEQREKVAKAGMKETTKILLAIKTEEVKVSEKQTDEQMKVLSQFKENFAKVLEKKPVKEQAKDIARILDSFYKKQRSTDKWGDCSGEEALLKQYMEKKGSAEFIAEAKALYSEYEKQIENEYRDYVNRDIPENLLLKKGYAKDPKAHFEAATLCMGRTEAFRRISGLKKMLGLLGVENKAIPAGFGTLLVEKSENAKYKYLNPKAVEKMHSIQDTFRQKSADCCLANYADPELLKVERKPVTEKDLDDCLKRIIGDWNSGKMTQPVDYEKLPTYEQAVKEQAALEKEFGKLDLKTIAIQRGLANIQVEHNKVIANNYKTLMMVPKDISNRQDIDNRCTGTLRELLNGDMDCFMAFVYGEPDMMTQYMDSAMRTFLSSSVIKGNYSIDNYAVDTMSMYLSNGLAVYLDEYISRAKTKGYFENLGETAKDKVFSLMRLVALNNTILASSARVAGFNPAQGDARFKQEALRDSQEDFEDNKEAMEMMIEQKIKEVVGKFPDLFTDEQKKQWLGK